MAGAPNSNKIEYVFEGNTVNLEQAITRLQKRLGSITRHIRQLQGGKTTKDQKAMIKNTKELLNSMIDTYTYGLQHNMKFPKEQAQAAKRAGKQAIENVEKLSKFETRLQNRETRARQEDRIREQRRAERREAGRAFAGTTAGQLQAGQQAAQLARLAKYTKGEIGAPAYAEITSTVNAYNEAVKAFQKGIITEEELKDKTIALNKVYKNYKITLQGIANQLDANNKKGTGLISKLFKKFGKVFGYRLIRQAVVKIITEIGSMFKAIAELSKPFDDSMSKLTSSIKYVTAAVTSMLVPVLELIEPLISNISIMVGDLANKFAELFAAMNGSDVYVKAKYQLQDYLDTVKNATSTKGIDEINNLSTNTTESLFVTANVSESLENLGKFKDLITSISSLLSATSNPALESTLTIVTDLLNIISNILTALNPVIDAVTKITNFGSNLISTVLRPVLWLLNAITSNTKAFYTILASVAALMIVANWAKFIASLKMMIVNIVVLVAKIKDWIMYTVIATIKSKLQALANMWEAWTWWQKAIAVIASAGILAGVVAGIVLTATASTQASAQSAVNNTGGIAAMATGGVVTGTTLAVIGEGKYDEAVVPLGNSPQFKEMKESIADTVVARNSGSGNSNQPVVFNMDGRTLARALWPRLVETQNQVGVKLR